MFFLLRDIVLDAPLLPQNWTEKCVEIAAEKMDIPAYRVKNAEILSSSIDSRRGSPKIILTLKVEHDDPLLPVSSDEEFASYTPPAPLLPAETKLRNPIVVGTGPAGIFAALTLALAGAEPIIIDRGSNVKKRQDDYRRFLETRILDPESNLLIGEGGAGTFSDGKLYTGTKDFRAAWVKKIFAECGAPAEILWQKRAHIGSDFLAAAAAGLREKIESLGGRFLFNTQVTSLYCVNGVCAGVCTASGETLAAPRVLLAPGLGGRYLIRNLLKTLDWSLKPFQIGCRVEHPQEMIDRAMYHMPRPAALGAAEYHIVSRCSRRHTASFCMCPGGEIVNATAWEDRSVSNGMSYFSRSGEFANSCLISTFLPEEFSGLEEIDAMIVSMEKNCFSCGGGNYTLPAQDIYSFLRGENGLKNTRTNCSTGIVAGRIDRIVPAELKISLSSAFKDFDRRMKGFISRGKLVGVESCVSSPVRISRDRESMQTSLPHCYCAGEGCGLAGGIISAACDGIACAEKMLSE